MSDHANKRPPIAIDIGFTGTQVGMKGLQRRRVLSVLKYYDGKSTARIAAHHGDCIGADAEFHELAKEVRAWTVGHLPLSDAKRAFCEFDEVRDPKPYLERNMDIVLESDVLIAAPGEFKEKLRSGTWATIRRARHVKRPTIIVFPNGTVKRENWDAQAA